MSRRKPDPDQELAVQEPSERQRKPVRKPGRDVNEIFRVGDDAEDEPEFLNSIPAHADVRRFVKHNYGGGDYLIKNRVGGKFKGERELHIEFTTGELVTGERDDDDAEDFELNAPNGVASLAPEDLVKLVSTTVNATIDARDRAQRAAQGQPDPMETFRQMRELLKEEREEMRREMRSVLEVQTRNNPAPVEEDEETSVAKILVKNPAIAERVMSRLIGASADAEPEPWYADVIKTLGANPQLLAGGIGAVKGMFNQQQQPAANGNGNHAPQLAPQGAPQVDPVTATFAVIVDGLRKNKRVGASADAIEELLTKMPEMKEQIVPLLAAPAPTLLNQLSQIAGEDLSAYSHSVAWVEDLQDELKGDAGDDEGSESEESPESVKSKTA